ncbi:MAG: Hsp70 family protein, partial [Planctomycetes bacterium]|nr:Hsp70 family protein [Planctomycetota bacterium]
MKKQRYPVGIDLGTTFSSLAYVNEAGQPQVIRFTDDDSSIAATSYSIASAIYFQSESEVVVGNRALDFALLDPLRVARVFKRQMGEPEYRREVGRDTYETFEVEGRCYRPEELSAMVLRRLKETAESQLGPIQDVVVSVPYVFDEVRRRATQDAAKIAGFVNVDLVDEPVAAAMAFGHTLFRGLEEQKTFDDEALSYIYDDRVILVYDLGGGTFDATLMRLGRDGVFEVLATAGDWRLGGEDWDNILLGILCEKVQSLTGSDPRNEPALLQELWLKAVQAKQTLSEKPRAEVVFFHNEDEHTIVLTRGDFQRESRHLLARTSDTISEMFARADIQWNVVECVVIVGGASRMPMVREHLENVSKRGHLDMSLSPDTAIAKGAALFAAMNSGQTLTSGIKDVETVNSHPLGLLVKD